MTIVANKVNSDMKPVKVIDSVMGAGKTTWAINYINEASPLERFVYITPLLSECDRIIKGVTNRDFVQPNKQAEGGSKLKSLKCLIESGKDIAASHKLFEMADDELRELLRINNYTLILDEVMNVVEKSTVSKYDMELLEERGFIEYDKTGRVQWVAKDSIYEYGVYDHIKLRAQAGTLYYIQNTFLIYAFPPSIFETFTNVYVLTYLFDAQLMKYYFDMYGIPYEKFSVKDGELVTYDPRLENRQALRKLINVYDGPHNKHGEHPTAFSVRWLKRRNDDEFEAIQKSMVSYVRKIAKAKTKDVMWTTIKDCQHDLKGKGYAKGFIACNARATNEFKDRTTLMYMFNRFMNPYETKFFEGHGIRISDEKLAVSDLLQWIWRSNIREGGKVNLYMPSARMRQLLDKWSRYEI